MVERLTGQQRRCLALAALGATNDEIADRLGLARDTVRTHLNHAYERLDVDGRGNPRAAAAALWAREGRREE
jgi:DNA-binding CsgD family transcriptional regulator